MKIEEIMIGDWVNIDIVTRHSLSPTRIETLDKDSINGEDNRNFTPIPLTPEILEKNGFKKINSQRYDFGYPDTDCYIKVNPKKNMIHVNGRNANSNLYSHSYVHELQRALRCCGLWELANNFKVE